VANVPYTCVLAVTSAGASTAPTVVATLSVAPASLNVSKGSLALTTAAASTTPVADTVAVTGPPTAGNFKASSSATGISVNPTTGITPVSIAIQGDPRGMPPATHTGKVTLAAED